jgi:hypothetical protein
MLPLILVAVAIQGASAIPYVPQPTTNFAHPAIEGFSPATTGIAKAGNFLELFKRAVGPNTCGYISASSCKAIF